ncbi:hypothetical protein, partial [Listeria booriae]|uniref:hypothetical protein n=1 Tax=Listeria booriae TaxID=1552123 RepID=UPI001C8ABFF8
FEQSELRSQYKRERSDGLIHKKEAMSTKSPSEREAIANLFPPCLNEYFLEAFEQSELRSQYKRERSDGLIHKKEAMFTKSPSERKVSHKQIPTYPHLQIVILKQSNIKRRK